MNVVLTPEAKADVIEAATWYRIHSVQAAENFMAAMSAAVERLERNPTAYSVIDVETGARRTFLRKFPHRLFYLIEESRIVVFAVVHNRRDEPAWRDRLE